MEIKENKIIQLEKEKLELLEILRIYGSEIYCENIENKLKDIDRKIKKYE